MSPVLSVLHRMKLRALFVNKVKLNNTQVLFMNIEYGNLEVFVDETLDYLENYF